MDIEFLTSIANIVTTIVAIVTITEMWKDRKAARQPELIIRNNEMFAIRNAREFGYTWDRKPFDNLDRLHRRCDSSLTLENIGMGVAKNIQIEWIYDIQKFKRIVLDFDDRFKNGSFTPYETIEWLDESSNIPEIIVIIYNSQHKANKIEYLSPNHDSEYRNYFELPEDYCTLYAWLLHLKAKDEDYHNIILDVPKLILKLRYEDIGGVKYKKKYEVKFSTINYADNDYDEILPGVTVEMTQTKSI